MDLVLPLKREFFEAIKAGTKREEFRLRNDYWRNRLEGKTFDRVILTLGYPKRDDAERRIVLPWQGYRECQITHPIFGADPMDVFAINVRHAADLPGTSAVCQCRQCLRDRKEESPPGSGWPVEMTRMICCETCGNKRCPHATDHRHPCTGSNNPGQPGSAYSTKEKANV